MIQDVSVAIDRVYRSDWDRVVATLISLIGDMPLRLEAGVTVIYPNFNKGYATTRGEGLVRADLCTEAIRLGRLVR